MDRTWITNGTRFTPAYMEGVRQFMECAHNHVSDHENMLCPCRDCLNHVRQRERVVEEHLHLNGISNAYTRWTHHGEELSDNEDNGGEDGAYFGDDDNDDVCDDNDDVCDDNNDVPVLVEELFTSRRQDDGKCNLFSNLMDEAKKELYPGHSDFTRLSFIIKLLHIKSYNRTTNTAFNAYLQLLNQAIPGANIPKSYSDAKAVLREVGLGYESIHVCKFDCALYWGGDKEATHCPICGTSRWKDSDGKKKIPWKVLRYFPIIPRLQRFFVSPELAEQVRWHKEQRVNEEGVLRHPADGEAWKHFDREFPWFVADPRNIKLGIATDGFNPFGNMSSSYSMWPVFVIPYNFPPWMCMDQANFMMTLLIPGKYSPGKDFDVFMQPLMADLEKLWKGVDTYDASTKKHFPLHAALIWSIHDYPGLATLSGRSTRGYYACVHCDENACFECIRSKIGYVGHRRFLPTNHPLRRNKVFNGKVETRDAPRKFTYEETIEMLDKVKYTPGKHPSNKKRKRTDKLKPNWSKKVSFHDLPYWPKLKLPHNLDVMHIEKNILDNILGTLLELEGRSKDTIKARRDLEDWNVRPELHMQPDGKGGFEKKHACYTLPRKKKEKLCEYLSNVKFPDGYASNLARCVDLEACKVYGLKTHDCHILLQCVLPVGLRGLVRKDIYEAIAELGSFFRELCSKTLKLDVLQRLKKDIPIILCKLEMIFPPAFFDVMVHLCVHLPDEAIIRGPVHFGWMYPIERRLGYLKGTVRNKARPEGSIAKGYIVDECLNFCSRYFNDTVQTRYNKDDRNQDGKQSVDPDVLPIFSDGAKCFGASKLQYFEKEYNKMVWLVLQNSVVANKFMCVFREQLLGRGVEDIDGALEKEFPTWFQKKVDKLVYEGVHDVHEDIISLSRGPDKRVLVWSACNVNGARFHTVDREKNRRTQNSGILVKADDANGAEQEYFGVLKEVLELQYQPNKHGNRSVILFRCDWFDIDGKKTGIRDDGYCRSVNITALCYKNDPFILANQAKTVYYLDDTLLGKNWRVVQVFTHRNMYDMGEKENSSATDEQGSQDVYQEDNASTDYNVRDVPEVNLESLVREDEDATYIDAQTVEKEEQESGHVSSSSSEDEHEKVVYENDKGPEKSDDDSDYE